MTYKRNIKGILGSSTNQGYIAIYILRMYIYQQVSTLVSTLTPPKCQPLTPTAKVSRMLRRSFWLISSVSDKLIIRTIILCVSNFNSYFGLPYFIAYSSSIRISLVHNNIITTFKVVGYQRTRHGYRRIGRSTFEQSADPNFNRTYPLRSHSKQSDSNHCPSESCHPCMLR